MVGRLATHMVDVLQSRDEAPSDSIDTTDPVHKGLPCHILTREQGAAVITRLGVEFDQSLGATHYVLAMGRYAETVTSGRFLEVTHKKNPVTRHWAPQANVRRYLVRSAVTAAGAQRHVYAAVRRV